MTTRESYRILGVTAKTGWEEIRRRFRTLARQLHPDLNPGNPQAGAQFRRLVQAYETVRTHLARAPRGEKRYYRTSAKAKEEFFEEIFGFEPREEPWSWRSGPDFRYDLRIPFVEAFLGMSTAIMVPRLSPCHHCDGSGWRPESHNRVCGECHGQGCRPLGPGMLRRGVVCRSCQGRGLLREEPCPVCEGQGQRLHYQRHHLSIPPGTEEGARLRIIGEGGEGFPAGPRGNLEVVISVEPHEFFTRRGMDLYYRLKVSFAQAALGSTVRVPTLRGYRTIALPRGTENGHRFRFPGAGAPGGPLRPAGDQIIEVMVTTPERFSRDQRDLLEELARLGKEDIGWAAHE